MLVTVIVCTHNRRQLLAKALESIGASVLPSEVEWEILVVDNNSTDQTGEVVEEYARRFPGKLRYLREPRQGLSHARNAGVRGSSSDIVAFTDDDVEVEPAWLWNLTATLLSGEWAGTGGRIVPVWSRPKPHWLELDDLNISGLTIAFDLGSSALPLTRPPFGANMAFRRRMFDLYGGFRTDLGRSGTSVLCGEETEFCARLFAGGERMRYEPSAVVRHPVPDERMHKGYILKWRFGSGVSAVAMSGPPNPGNWSLWGVPLWLVRGLLKWSVLSLTSGGARKRFKCRENMASLAGTIVGCYRWWRAKPSGVAPTVINFGIDSQGNSVRTNSGS